MLHYFLFQYFIISINPNHYYQFIFKKFEKKNFNSYNLFLINIIILKFNLKIIFLNIFV